MAEQLALFDRGNVNMQQFQPLAHIKEGAERYVASQGGTYDSAVAENAHVPGPLRYARGMAFEEGIGKPVSLQTSDSAQHMAQETDRQFDFLTRSRQEGGVGLNVQFTPDDPYGGDAKAMAADVSSNNTLKVWTGESEGHDALTPEQNHRFRAVHDAFGHLATGRGFSHHGEEGAFLSHQQMYPPEAHRSMASETRGQNSYLAVRGEFPGNQTNEMPGWMSTAEGKPPAQAAKPSPDRGEQLRLFHG